MADNARTKIYEFPTLLLATKSMKIDVLSDLVKEGRIDPLMMLRLELAVQEAVTNSIEHGNLGLSSTWKEEIGPDGVDRFSKERIARLGNPEYADKRVVVVVELDEKKIEICVKDQGAGFIPSQALTSQGLETFGRGIAMIKANVDEVSFEDEGRSIRMVKRF